MTGGLAGALGAARGLVLTRACAGCGAPDVGLCPPCRSELADLALGVRGPVAPSPVPPGWPGCHATVRYEGVATRLATAFKDEERRDLAGPLGRLLADAVARALLASGHARERPVLLVPVPSSSAAVRRRGDRPMLLLARHAARHVGPAVEVAPVLSMVRRTADQAGLDRLGRLANLRGAMVVPRPGRVVGRHCLLVDDVLTSGATLSEGQRALLSAGAATVTMAAAMVTPRRSPGVHLSFRPSAD